MYLLNVPLIINVNVSEVKIKQFTFNDYFNWISKKKENNECKKSMHAKRISIVFSIYKLNSKLFHCIYHFHLGYSWVSRVFSWQWQSDKNQTKKKPPFNNNNPSTHHIIVKSIHVKLFTVKEIHYKRMDDFSLICIQRNPFPRTIKYKQFKYK